MSIDAEECRRQALSEEYYDYIGDLSEDSLFGQLLEENYCVQRINEQYVVVYLPREEQDRQLDQSPYSSVPKCYGLADVESMSDAGIDRIQVYPGLNLTGKDVILGIVDTGIDYQNQVFQNPDGSSRILRIWDQSDQSGSLPAGFVFGSEYTKEQIDQALTMEDPLALVPVVDENGHGTAVAAIAAGSGVSEEGFLGAAPGADIVAVKLKGAKSYLREYYQIAEEAQAFQENDIMLGVLYLLRLSYITQKSLVICLALGTNLGDHAGNSPLGSYLDRISRQRMRSVVTATGNEANAGHHFQGVFSEEQEYEDVEIRVGENVKGFVAELWGNTPSLYGISVLSPSGERLPRIPVGIDRMESYEFVFEQTLFQLTYRVPEMVAGDPLAFMRFVRPAPGIWTIRVYPVRGGAALKEAGRYHMWLPLTAFVGMDTYFLRSSPDVTLTEPSALPRALSTGAYDGQNNSIDIQSGRGYNRRGVVKPELCAPGVNVLTALPGNRYVRRTGTSMAAGITAGAAALLLEWFRNFRKDDSITNAEIKGYLISGARQLENRTYPNRECGYGTLDLYNSFDELRIQ